MSESDSSDSEFVEAKESWEDLAQSFKVPKRMIPKEEQKIPLTQTSFMPGQNSVFSKIATERKRSFLQLPTDNRIVKLNASLNSEIAPKTYSQSVIVKFPKVNPTKPKSTAKKIYSRVPPISVIHTQRHMKDFSEYNQLFLQQEIRASAYAICVAQFSEDGFFFATAGEDCVVRIWELSDFTYHSNFYK